VNRATVADMGSVQAGDLAPPSGTAMVRPLRHMLNVIPDAVTGLAPEEATYLFHGVRYGPDVKADLTAWLRATLSSARTASPGPG
jgi:hypothetical protein